MKKGFFFRYSAKDGDGKCFIHCENEENEVIKTNGYIETVTDRYGNEITLCFHNNGNRINKWTVSEKTTGLRLCSGRTRKEALQLVMEKYIDKITKTLSEHPTLISKIKAEIQAAYEQEENK